MSYLVETTIEGYVDRWIVFTGDYDDFVPADEVWRSMLHAAGQQPTDLTAWGMRRKAAFEVLRELLPIPRQALRYYRPSPQPPTGPKGYTAACYERIRLTPHAKEALSAPLRVRRRRRRVFSTENTAGSGVRVPATQLLD